MFDVDTVSQGVCHLLSILNTTWSIVIYRGTPSTRISFPESMEMSLCGVDLNFDAEIST
jgi:hypothetical protein